MDLLINPQQKLSDKDLVVLLSEFEESDLPFEVDIHELSKLSDKYQKAFKKKAILVADLLKDNE